MYIYNLWNRSHYQTQNKYTSKVVDISNKSMYLVVTSIISPYTGMSGFRGSSLCDMYAGMLEKLYGYSGIMADERQQLKQDLIHQKDSIETKILDQMEDIITHVLVVSLGYYTTYLYYI